MAAEQFFIGEVGVATWTACSAADSAQCGYLVAEIVDAWAGAVPETCFKGLRDEKYG